MQITREQVKHIAKLSQLKLSEEEVATYQNDLSVVVDYMDKLNSVNTMNVNAADHAMAVPLKLREDKICSSFKREEILQNAPKQDDGFFVVPKVVD